jgi:hypothetical protein
MQNRCGRRAGALPFAFDDLTTGEKRWRELPTEDGGQQRTKR